MDEQQIVRYTPKNPLNTGKVLGIKVRNLIEGVIVAAGFTFIILLIPFVLKIKIITIIASCVCILVLNCMGIHGTAISTTIISLIRYRYYLHKFHYRRITNEHENPKSLIDDNKKLRINSENKTINVAKKFIGK